MSKVAVTDKTIKILVFCFFLTLMDKCRFMVIRTSKFRELWSPARQQINKFDLEIGQRSPSMSRHGTIGKVLSQRTHMPNIKALPVIVQKLWLRLKFLWRTDGQTDRRADRRMRFNVPALSRKRGTISQCNFSARFKDPLQGVSETHVEIRAKSKRLLVVSCMTRLKINCC